MNTLMPRLYWVIVEGQLRHVSDFQHLSPQRRPEAKCPICMRTVTLKLGQKNVHHFSHQPEDECAANSPETALHLNTKFHIYHQLLNGHQLYIPHHCQTCSEYEPWLWEENWDQVEVEYTFSSIRPDIVLLREGKAIGAIEILVSHAVDAAKAEILREQEMKWIEVSGDESLYSAESAWTTESLLNVVRVVPNLPHRECENCVKIRNRQEYSRKNFTEIRFGRIIDCYYGSGKKYRQAYYVKSQVVDGVEKRLWIETEDGKTIAKELHPIDGDSHQRLNKSFREEMDKLRKKCLVLDDYYTWRKWIVGNRFMVKDIGRFPFRYQWDDKQSKWVLQSNSW